MSTTQGGGNIVADGLVLYLDAANTKSYLGSGTAWTDLSKVGNNGTLTNGPTFNSTNGGNIVFDGTNDYIDCGNSNSLKFVNGDSFTISSWVKPISPMPTTVSAIAQHGGTPGSATGFILYLTNSGFVDFAKSNVANTGQNVTTTPFQFNLWNNIVCTILYSGSSGQIQFYINGVLKATYNGWSANPLLSDYVNSLYVGRSSVDSFFSFTPFYGNIANVSIYNKRLSDQEVLQNYNVTKSRFGL